MNIILSTRNPSKADQIRAIFNNLPITIKTLEDMGITGEAIEDGTTLEENSKKKALYAHRNSDGTYWTMADDTGLFISALNGEPGIHAARWAGDVSTEETLAYCLKRLSGISDRSAYFETCVVLISPGGKEYSFTGKINGTLLEKPSVTPQPKMPYSCIFNPIGTSKVWAQMSTEEENKISHRGQAFRKALTFLKTQL